ncbi:tRNA (adenine(22)-N(1))-methyltransferase [Spiroplasma culicicola]|uniref:tRNA: m1A22 methyltransferase n=1 Tax=Spiroplasma culicicola AES-1 TaxID=1276246 RepID=W6A7U7_9MOLU|nr:class I SAM-dependent methyltransferase [Spiroplasma culicicola]AHI53067.1 tRNA: m1A22 methyltransferase [Spiroplasma culicicola AES-1]
MSFLTPRLFAIASMVSYGEVVADIGTDHAYLSIYLAKDSKAVKIYATDINEKPLQTAKNNILSFGVKDKVETILANGIEWTKEQDIKINSCIIAGMGSTTILDILKMDNNNIDCYIISSNTGVEPIRQWAKQKKYFIESESIIIDNEIIYEIIKINKFAGQKIKSKQDLLFGPILKKDTTNQLFVQKWMSEEQKIMELIKQIPKKEKKVKLLKQKQKLISKMLKKETR